MMGENKTLDDVMDWLFTKYSPLELVEQGMNANILMDYGIDLDLEWIDDLRKNNPKLLTYVENRSQQKYGKR